MQAPNHRRGSRSAKSAWLLLHPTMIADDTATHYLPERKTIHRGRDGATGLVGIVDGAARGTTVPATGAASTQRTHHGPTGDVLRLFLLSCGWMGLAVRQETCIKGHRSTFAARRKASRIAYAVNS